MEFAYGCSLGRYGTIFGSGVILLTLRDGRCARHVGGMVTKTLAKGRPVTETPRKSTPH